jgi:hypothetical protein
MESLWATLDNFSGAGLETELREQFFPNRFKYQISCKSHEGKYFYRYRDYFIKIFAIPGLNPPKQRLKIYRREALIGFHLNRKHDTFPLTYGYWTIQESQPECGNFTYAVLVTEFIVGNSLRNLMVEWSGIVFREAILRTLLRIIAGTLLELQRRFEFTHYDLNQSNIIVSVALYPHTYNFDLGNRIETVRAPYKIHFIDLGDAHVKDFKKSSYHEPRLMVNATAPAIFDPLFDLAWLISHSMRLHRHIEPRIRDLFNRNGFSLSGNSSLVPYPGYFKRPLFIPGMLWHLISLHGWIYHSQEAREVQNQTLSSEQLQHSVTPIRFLNDLEYELIRYLFILAESKEIRVDVISHKSIQWIAPMSFLNLRSIDEIFYYVRSSNYARKRVTAVISGIHYQLRDDPEYQEQVTKQLYRVAPALYIDKRHVLNDVYKDTPETFAQLLFSNDNAPIKQIRAIQSNSH